MRKHPTPYQSAAILAGVAALLYVSAIAGISYVAGFQAVFRYFDKIKPMWLLVSFAGVTVSCFGYYLAFEGLAMIPGGPDLTRRERIATVAAGFGCFLFKGGIEVDNSAMKRGGANPRVANVRVSALKSLEHAPIAIGTCIAAIALLTLKHPTAPSDFTWPWAICPIVGATIALTLAARYRLRLRDRSGILRGIGIALEGIWMLREMAFGRKSKGLPFIGMTIFWLADIVALWGTLQAFSSKISFAGIIVAYAVGYVLTRRSAPLGGAGLIDLILPLTLWACGATFPAAVAAIAVYRFFSLWIPLPAAFLALPTVRAIAAPPLTESEPVLQVS